MPPGTAHVELRFAAPTFVSAKRPRFEQRIDGVDTSWSLARDNRSANLARLPAGSYRFRVRLRGVSANEASVAFVVLAPWWRRTAVAVAAVGLLVALGFAVHRLRLRRLAARFEAITVERSRIARELHDGLAQQFVGVGFQLAALQTRMPRDDAETQALLEDARAMIKDAQQDSDACCGPCAEGSSPTPSRARSNGWRTRPAERLAHRWSCA